MQHPILFVRQARVAQMPVSGPSHLHGIPGGQFPRGPGREREWAGQALGERRGEEPGQQEEGIQMEALNGEARVGDPGPVKQPLEGKEDSRVWEHIKEALEGKKELKLEEGKETVE